MEFILEKLSKINLNISCSNFLMQLEFRKKQTLFSKKRTLLDTNLQLDERNFCDIMSIYSGPVHPFQAQLNPSCIFIVHIQAYLCTYAETTRSGWVRSWTDAQQQRRNHLCVQCPSVVGWKVASHWWPFLPMSIVWNSNDKEYLLSTLSQQPPFYR